MAMVVLVSAMLLALAGCASPRGIGSTARSIGLSDVGVVESAIAEPVAADWWQAFGGSELDGLVTRALAGNPSLKLAQARSIRAQAGADLARAAEGLNVQGQFDATRQRFTANGLFPPPIAGSVREVGTLQAGASWEFDFFGRSRAALDAALGSERAAQADMQAARVLLAANVARAYVQLARLIEQRAVALRALQQREEMLSLIRQRVQAGLDTQVELKQGEGALPETRALIEALNEQIALTRNALAALTGQPMQATQALSPSLQAVPGAALPMQVPADLIGRRADIAAARSRVEAATGDVASARAQFYPNVNLTAFAGFSAIGLDRLLRSSSEQWGVGPAIRLPLFDAGRLRANLKLKSADLDAAVESYNAALVDAVREVADQIASLQSIARQQAEQTAARESAEAAYEIATQRYKAGLGTFLVVLNAEGNVLAQRRAATDLKARALDAQVGLARALGGGYVDTRRTSQ